MLDIRHHFVQASLRRVLNLPGEKGSIDVVSATISLEPTNIVGV